jgi:hypothetical protein
MANPASRSQEGTSQSTYGVRVYSSFLCFPLKLDVCRIPLPKEVPMAFRVLPEYIVEDIVTYLHYVTQ